MDTAAGFARHLTMQLAGLGGPRPILLLLFGLTSLVVSVVVASLLAPPEVIVVAPFRW